jgi:hypothetical protein
LSEFHEDFVFEIARLEIRDLELAGIEHRFGEFDMAEGRIGAGFRDERRALIVWNAGAEDHPADGIGGKLIEMDGKGLHILCLDR